MYSNDDNCNQPLIIFVCSEERKVNYSMIENRVPSNVSEYMMTRSEIYERNLSIPENVGDDTILLQHPFEHTRYITIESIDECKNEKFYIYKEIIQLLGATSFKFESAKQTSQKLERSISGKIKYKPVKIKVKYKSKEECEHGENLKLDGKFAGKNSVSEKSYNEAKELIHKYHLEDDSYIGQLVRARNPRMENRELSEHLQIHLMDDFNKRVEAAAAFSFSKVIQFSGSFKEAVRTKKDVVIDITVNFPE